MKKSTIIFSTVLALVFSFSLSYKAYTGFGFGLPSAIKERVKKLDKKVEEKKAEEGNVNHAPNVPSSPSPPDGANNQPINLDLTWSGGDPDAGDTVVYDVYFGTNNPPTALVPTGQTTTYSIGALNYNTTYYWKIVAKDNHDSSSAGPAWSFTTITGSSDSYTASGSVSTNSSGVIETQSGAKINVPMYAVPTMENGDTGTIFFSIEVDTATSPVVSDTETIASDIYRFGPDGFVFASPVEITIPLKSVPDPSQEVLIYRVNPTTGELERYSGVYDSTSNSISTQTYKFSPYFSTTRTADNTAAGAIRITNNSSSKWIGVCVEEYTLTYPTTNVQFGQASFAPSGTIGWTSSGLMILGQGTYRLCIEMSEAGTISSPPGPKSHIFLDDVVVDKPYTYTNPVVSRELAYSSLPDAIDGPCPCVPTPTLPVGTGAVQVTLTWHSADAIDLDLWVTDPSGEKCYWGNPSTTSGGTLDRDNQCGNYVNGKPENIFWSNAPGGEYKVEVDWYSGCGNAISSMPYEVRVRNKNNVKTYTGVITSSPGTIEVCKFNVWGPSNTLAGNWKMTGSQRIFPDVVWEADLILYPDGTLSWTETKGANVGANRIGEWEYDGNTFKMHYTAPNVGLVNWQSSSVTTNSMSNGDYQTPEAGGDYGGSWSANKQ